MAERLTLKWGTLKGWRFESPAALALLTEYGEIGHTVSAALQRDSDRQKEIICELIDIGTFDTVYLSWDGKDVSKEEAKKWRCQFGASNCT